MQKSEFISTLSHHRYGTGYGVCSELEMSPGFRQLRVWQRFGGETLNFSSRDSTSFTWVLFDPLRHLRMSSQPLLHHFWMLIQELFADEHDRRSEASVWPQSPFIQKDSSVSFADE